MTKTNYHIINGLLGTLIVHLGLGIFVLSRKIAEVNKEYKEVKVEVVSPEELKAIMQEMQKPQPKKDINIAADAFINQQKRSNIGVNITDNEKITTKLKEEISTEAYIKQLQSELDAGKPKVEINTPDQTEKNEHQDGDESVKQQQKASKSDKPKYFKGATNIYYSLENRHDVRLPIPVYKCEGTGKIVLDITVDQQGNVTNAAIDKKGSDPDDCLYEAAVTAAQRTRFNADAKAPANQKGTITYQFVAQ